MQCAWFICHCTKEFSDSYENRITSRDESNATLRGEDIDSLIRQTHDMPVIDSACIRANF